jgi:hypothetical protein
MKKISIILLILSCHSSIFAQKIFSYTPITFANSTYLSPGQELQITAGIGAFIKSAKTSITINNTFTSVNKDGFAVYKMNVGNSGGSIPVRVQFTDQNGNEQIRNLKIDYSVASSNRISLNAEKVKVLYIGLENELQITCDNMNDGDVYVSTNNGNIRKIGNGKYFAMPVSSGTAEIAVKAGNKKEVFSIKVKSIPDPTPLVGNSSGGRMASNVFKAQEGIRAELNNFIFEGIKYEIISYTFFATGAGFQEAPGIRAGIRGNRFENVQDLMSRCRPGTTVVLDEIKAMGPDGTTRKLPTIAFNLY